jgi:hypothetical protein
MCTPNAKWPFGQARGITQQGKEIQFSPDFQFLPAYENFTCFMSFLDVYKDLQGQQNSRAEGLAARRRKLAPLADYFKK